MIEVSLRAFHLAIVETTVLSLTKHLVENGLCGLWVLLSGAWSLLLFSAVKADQVPGTELPSSLSPVSCCNSSFSILPQVLPHSSWYQSQGLCTAIASCGQTPTWAGAVSSSLLGWLLLLLYCAAVGLLGIYSNPELHPNPSWNLCHNSGLPNKMVVGFQRWASPKKEVQTEAGLLFWPNHQKSFNFSAVGWT